MTGNKFYLRMSILILTVIIIWTSYNMLGGGKEEDSHLVSVIVNDSNNDRWIALRLGLEQAAKDYNIDLNYVFTGKFADWEEEKAVIYRELDNGAEGIIVQMISGAEEEESDFADISSKAALMLLESDIKPENLYALVEPDNIGIGRAVADSIKQDFGTELKGRKIGILSGNQNRISVRQRLQGVKEGLTGEDVEIIWCVEDMEFYDGETTAAQEQTILADIVIALGNTETEKMIDYMLLDEEFREKSVLYGVGCSEKAVYYLNKGMVKTLVVPNEFNMGYQGMEALAMQLQYHSDKAEGSRVDYLVVNRSNMYDQEMQKVLFPIVQ